MKRAIQIRMVKPKDVDPNVDTPNEDDFSAKTIYVAEAAQTVMREGVKMLAAFVVLDTMRQVIIEKSKR